MKPPPLITLMSDFGSRDSYVAAMKGVILTILPNARIVDITHDIPPFAIASAAYTLKNCCFDFPKESIHVAVVDPGVGSERRPLLLQAAEHTFIGPDNGLFGFLTEIDLNSAMEIDAAALPNRTLSSTFHGRDLFAPAAALLAKGKAIGELGSPVPLESIHLLEQAKPKLTASSPKAYSGETVHIDRFGNLITNIDAKLLQGDCWQVAVEGVQLGPVRRCYQDVPKGDPLALIGSSGYLEIAVHAGSASDFFRGKLGAMVYVKAEQ